MGYAENPSAHEFAMKPRRSQQRNRALTRTDVVVIIAVLAVLCVPVLRTVIELSHNGRQKIYCVSNLKQIGIAYRLWEGDNNNQYPMAVSVTNGGAMELVATGNVAACFRAMSNELSTPKILLCPQDTHRTGATNFSVGFGNSNISYFIGVDVANDDNPNLILTGDDNLAISRVPIKPGILPLFTNTPVTWTKARHKFVGWLGMADGCVQHVTTAGLKNALIQTGTATNRWLIP
jgi:hypothetical protein